MNIDPVTLQVLKNFSTINAHILVKPGNVLETINEGKSIKVKAMVPVEFPTRFALYNLPKFLNTLSLFKDPSIEFTDRFLTIKSTDRSAKIVYTDEDLIIKLPDREFKMPPADITVTLRYEDLKSLEKAASVIGTEEICIVGDGSKLSLQAVDTKNVTSDAFLIEVGETEHTFRAVFKRDNLRLIPADYQVDLCFKGIACFMTDTLEYFIALELSSSFVS